MNDQRANDDGQSGHNSPANNRIALRQVARRCRKAALSTILADGAAVNAADHGGAPYVSLVTVAFDHDLAPILLLSGLSEHSRGLAADARVALLLDGTDGLANPQTGPRVTLTGFAQRTEDERLKRRFLARHPSAAMYAGFGDFGFWRVEPERAHYVGGFGRAVWFKAPFGLHPTVCAAFAEAESAPGGIVADASVVAADPDGCDVAHGDSISWKAFPTPLDAPEWVAPALLGSPKGVNP